MKAEEGRKERADPAPKALLPSLELASCGRKWRHKATRPERGGKASNGQMGIGPGTKLALLFTFLVCRYFGYYFIFLYGKVDKL